MCPAPGLTQYEEMSKKGKEDRFKGGGIEQLGNGPMGAGEQAKEFDRIEMAAKLFAPPPIKFGDLDAALDAFSTTHKLLSGPPFPFDVRTDFVKVTDSMDLVPITIQFRNRDITFVTKDGVSKGVVNILGKVTTIMHKTVQTFEDTVEVEQPRNCWKRASTAGRSTGSRSRCRRDSTAWISPSRMSTIRITLESYGRALNVPTYQDDKIGASSLILADQMNTVSSRQIGSGNFIISNTFIRPRVATGLATPVSFKRSQDLNFWMQFYNLGIDEATKSNSATVTYQITDAAREL